MSTKIRTIEVVCSNTSTFARCHKAPDIAFIRFDSIKLIDTPVVSLVWYKPAGRICRSSLCETTGGIVYIIKIVAEINCVQFRTETRCPANCSTRVYEFSSVSRNWFIGGFGRNHKAPDIAFPGTIGIGIIDLINTPVICCSRNKTFRISKTRKTCD